MGTFTPSKWKILTSLKHRLMRKGLVAGLLRSPSNKALLAILSSVIFPQEQIQAS